MLQKFTFFMLKQAWNVALGLGNVPLKFDPLTLRFYQKPGWLPMAMSYFYLFAEVVNIYLHLRSLFADKSGIFVFFCDVVYAAAYLYSFLYRLNTCCHLDDMIQAFNSFFQFYRIMEDKLCDENEVPVTRSQKLKIREMQKFVKGLNLRQVKAIMKSPDFEVLFFAVTHLQTTLAVPFFATIVFWISPAYDGFIYGLVPENLRSTGLQLVFASWEFFSVHLVWQNLAFYAEMILWFSTSFRYWLGEIGEDPRKDHACLRNWAARRTVFRSVQILMSGMNTTMAFLVFFGHQMAMVPLNVGSNYVMIKLHSQIDMPEFLVFPFISIECFFVAVIMYGIHSAVTARSEAFGEYYVKEHVRDPVERRVGKALRNVSVSMGGFYIVDKGMTVTYVETIINETVSALLI